ncbi:MAG: galactokinase [bacterium]
MSDRLQTLARKFESLFAARHAAAARAPGRVNLIGEHTDYNDGFVMPYAISMDVLALGRARNDLRMRLHSVNFDRTVEFTPGDSLEEAPPWLRYVAGVFMSIREFTGRELPGFDALVQGSVPIGSGLSSSAAVEVATGMLIADLNGLNVAGETLARLCQSAEHRCVGIRSGIMDQFASRLCRAGNALFLDCRTLEYEHVPLALGGHELLILDTGVSRGLAGSEYNARRAACEKGVALIAENLPRVRALRDVTPEVFAEISVRWDPVLRETCSHVVNENRRVLQSVEALRRGDLATFGGLMCESHASLRDAYRVSCPELDLLHDVSMKIEGVIGERMTGAGFGGCAIALVRRDAAGEYTEKIKRAYVAGTGRELRIYAAAPADGAGIIPAGAAANPRQTCVIEGTEAHK